MRNLLLATAMGVVIMGCTYSPITDYYLEDGNKCITLTMALEPFSGRGLYITPYKSSTGDSLPHKDYIRLGLNSIYPFYYKWREDSLFLRVAGWKIISEDLPSNVIVDSLWLDYERWGQFSPDWHPMYIQERKEWEQLLEGYNAVTFDWDGGFNVAPFSEFLKDYDRKGVLPDE